MPVSLRNCFKLLPLCWYWSCSDVNSSLVIKIAVLVLLQFCRAKVQHYYNCYNMYFIGCLHLYPLSYEIGIIIEGIPYNWHTLHFKILLELLYELTLLIHFVFLFYHCLLPINNVNTSFLRIANLTSR